MFSMDAAASALVNRPTESEQMNNLFLAWETWLWRDVIGYSLNPKAGEKL
jgi:hypothetical protein